MSTQIAEYSPTAAAAMDDITERGQQPVMDYIDGEMVVHPEEETINPETGEITQAPQQHSAIGEPPAVSVGTLIKRLNACKTAEDAAEIMTLPDVDLLNAEDAGKLMAAYRAKFGGE